MLRMQLRVYVRMENRAYMQIRVCAFYFDLSCLCGLCCWDQTTFSICSLSLLSISISSSLPLHPPTLVHSFFPLPHYSPLGLRWVFLSCFPLPYPVQFSLYQQLISTAWVYLCKETNERFMGIIKKKKKKMEETVFKFSFPSFWSSFSFYLLPPHFLTLCVIHSPTKCDSFPEILTYSHPWSRGAGIRGPGNHSPL